MRISLVLLFVGTLSACSGGSGTETTTPLPIANSPPAQPPVTSPTPSTEQFRLLFMGNSHTAANQLPDMVNTLINMHLAQQGGYVERVPQYAFLIDHAQSSSTLAQLENGQWSHVVLQAQKYSQSFQIDYPTTGALTLISRSQARNAIPIMFPEWAQRNRPNETEYIHNIHAQIAQETGACVAPIGYAWERALMIRPDIALHAADGNHANLLGSYLTALVIFETVTGEPADLLSPSQTVSIADDIQLFLGQMATYAIANHPPCDYR